MALNLIKLAVGAEDLESVARFQARRRRELGRLLHFTRMMPRRRDELLDGGSIYWVIRGLVRARQRILGIEAATDREGRAMTALVLDPELIRTEPRSQRAFQGWRYLTAEQAPRDLGQAVDGLEEMPPDMIAELRALGLI
ncbi:MAG: DUF1489 domain-containing protein [Kiloniellales bacterium]|nr:DUF1489 domain-containing protein [Kiloniellales bacterium]